MFTRDTLITMADRHAEPIGSLLDAPDSKPMVACSPQGGHAQVAALQSNPGEYLELLSEGGRRIKCSPRAKLCLVDHAGSAAGFVYAEESNGASVITESGTETITQVEMNGVTSDLVSVRLTSVHAVIANGFWFLVD